ncbi:hypothetical protein ACFL3U_06875 [Pseudomonadota bacterium]
MAEKVRVILDENQDVVRVEANVNGEWKEAESAKASADGGAQTMEGGCGTGTANCDARAGQCVYEIGGHCYYYPC